MTRSTQHLLPTGTHNLLAYRAARQAALRCLLIAQKAGPVPGDLKDQLIRSATGIPRNIAEGAGRTGKDRTHLFRIAYGSAHEASDTLEGAPRPIIADRREARIGRAARWAARSAGGAAPRSRRGQRSRCCRAGARPLAGADLWAHPHGELSPKRSPGPGRGSGFRRDPRGGETKRVTTPSPVWLRCSQPDEWRRVPSAVPARPSWCTGPSVPARRSR